MGLRAKFNGYEVTAPVRSACLAAIKTYPFLINTRKNMDDINGLHKSFADKVVDRADLDLKIREIEEAFGEIPSYYNKAVSHYLFSSDTKEQKKTYIETDLDMDYVEVVLWAEKLIYFFARNNGFPVSQRGEEFTLVIDDDGNVDID